MGGLAGREFCGQCGCAVWVEDCGCCVMGAGNVVREESNAWIV